MDVVMPAADVWTMRISTKCMIEANDKDGNPVPEYTGMLAYLGPKLVADFPGLFVRPGRMIAEGKIVSVRPAGI